MSSLLRVTYFDNVAKLIIFAELKTFVSHILLLTSLLVVFLLSMPSSSAAVIYGVSNEVVGGDTLPNIRLKPIYVFKRGIDRKRFWRLVTAVKRVYPVAKFAQQKLRGIEDTVAMLPTKHAQREYVRGVYRDIKEEYTPVFLKMSMTDGRVLIRLIDRETDRTAYEVIAEFRGGLTATFWHGIGKMFGQNLKDEYGKSDEDRMIEMIIRYYEAGLL